MKRISFVLILISLSNVLKAQTFQEWFNQNQTQIKYLVEQIATIGMYARNVKKGYEVAKTGLHNIKDLKREDLSIHTEHFKLLSKVSPAVKNYGKVKEIITLQKKILNCSSSVARTVKSNELLTDKESKYVKQVYQHLLIKSMKDLEELKVCVSDGDIELKDAERLDRIDNIHRQVLDKYSFSQSFQNGIKLLLLQRSKEQRETKSLQKIYGEKLN